MKRYVFGKSVKGATHEKNGLPLQDNCKIEEISDKITIIAVADGHGSSKCPRSDIHLTSIWQKNLPKKKNL